MFFTDPSVLLEPVATKETYYVGEQIIVNGCSFTSQFSESITVYWLKDGVVLQNASFTEAWENGKFTITIDNLVVDNAKILDAGKYFCRFNAMDTEINVESSKVNIAVSSKSYFNIFS